MAALLRRLPRNSHPNLPTSPLHNQNGDNTETGPQSDSDNNPGQEQTYPNSASQNKFEICFHELNELIPSKGVLLVDVRDPEQLAEQGMIPCSINIPITDLKQTLLELPGDVFHHVFHVPKPTKLCQNFVVYGQGPNQGITALEIAYKLGYKKVRHFPGGWMEWTEKTNQAQLYEINE